MGDTAMVQTPATGVRLVGVIEVEAAPAALRRSRAGGGAGGEAEAVLDGALAQAGMDVVADLVVAPPAVPAPPAPASRHERRAPSPQVESPRVEVDVAPGESALVLVEGEDGVFHWVFPDELHSATPEIAASDALRRTRGGAGQETLTFTLAPPGESPAASERRGLGSAIVDRLIEPVRIRVARFVAAQAIDLAVARIEGDLVEGLVAMDGPAVGWVAGAAPAPAPARARIEGLDRPARVLLFVHGTFSSVRGSFGALEATPAGRSFLEQARLRYDLVLGVDHRTLAVDPEANAALFEQALAFLPDGTEVDAVAFSRGGLVLRSTVARLGERLRFGKLVFVGCTNAGTHLAEPANWRTLVDLYTSILMAGTTLLGAATAPLVGMVTQQAIKFVAGFVKAMPLVGVEEGRVPGLAAMRPGSETIRRLARADALGTAGPVHVVASNFEPARGAATGIAGKLALFVGDRVVDRFFRDEANDLVVDTASMTDFGDAAEAPSFPLLREMPLEDAVYHVIYFAVPSVAEALHDWLLGDERRAAALPGPPPPGEPAIAPGAAMLPAAVAPPSPAPSKPSPPKASPGERRRSRSAPPEPFPAVPSDGGMMFRAFPDLPGADMLGDGIETAAAAVESVTPPHATASPHATLPPALPVPAAACFFAAEMDSAPVVARPVPLFVTVSRERIVAEGPHAGATMSPIAVSPSQPIAVTVTGLANCAVVGAAVKHVSVPDDAAGLRFQVEGFAPGLARVQVEIQQDGLPLASLLLEPVFLAGSGDKVCARVAAVPDRAAAGNAATLRIYELRQQDGSLLIRYDLSGRGLAETWDKVLPASFSMESFVGQFLGKLDAAYRQSRTEYRLFLARITEFAIDATNQLVPQDVRHALWEHRDRIDAIQVIADSPYMPWELLYIDDPAGGGRENRGFLAEWGLVRWMYNAVWPADTLHLRPDRVRYVIPDYLNVEDRLPQATQERDMLAQLFEGKAAAVERFEGEGQSESVGRFLARNAAECDLLHFACHGEAQQMAVLNSDLVLSGEVTDKGAIAEDLLSSSAVKRRALFHERGSEPSGMVFVNACQTGRAGEGISGVSGFADAFLRPVTEGGAAVFVGALWSVGDTLARTFAETFYTRLLAGDRLVDAVKAGRVACQGESDFTWLAYTVYGNPFARAR